MYATALRETVEEYGIEAKANGSLIVSKMWNRTIAGVTGDVSINSNGDRSADYALLDLDPRKGEFKVVAIYRGRTNSFEMDDTASIHWPNREGGEPPSDMPECGFDGSLCEKSKCRLMHHPSSLPHICISNCTSTTERGLSTSPRAIYFLQFGRYT